MNVSALCVVALLVASPAVASGKKVTLTVHSAPEGALIAGLGPTPIALAYRVTGCQTTQPLQVQWVSGVSTAVTLTLCEKTGKQQVYTVQRPEGEGLSLDLQAGLQRLLQIQASTPSDVYVSAPAVPYPRHCITNYIGRQAFTNCF